MKTPVKIESGSEAVPVEDGWDFEVEVRETEWGLEEDESDEGEDAGILEDNLSNWGSCRLEQEEVIDGDVELMDCESNLVFDVRDAEDVVTR